MNIVVLFLHITVPRQNNFELRKYKTPLIEKNLQHKRILENACYIYRDIRIIAYVT